jgi:hypothetical protein
MPTYEKKIFLKTNLFSKNLAEFSYICSPVCHAVLVTFSPHFPDYQDDRMITAFRRNGEVMT